MLGSSDIPRPPSTYQASQSPQAPPPNDLQKGGSVTSLKDALTSNTPQSLHEQSSSSKPFQFNTSSYLGVGGESLGHTSPRTPNTARTPDPATPVIPGMIVANSEGVSPLPSSQSGGGNLGNNSQNSPLEVEAILGLKDGGHTASVENGDSFQPSSTLNSKSPLPPKSVPSPSSSAGSPLNKKVKEDKFIF